jgi:predicted metal-dependent peptidase
MKVNIQDVAKVKVVFEPGGFPTPPPPPPPPGTPPSPPPPPPPGGEKPWDEEGGGGEPKITDDYEDGPDVDTVSGGKLPGTGPKIERDESTSWEDFVKDVYNRNAGSMPGALARLLGDMIRPPKLDWKEKLKKFVSSIGSKLTYKLPNKRFLGSGSIQWGTKKTKSSIDTCVIISDTSGSMTEEEINQHMSEAADIINNLQPKETYIIFCDAQISGPVYLYKRGEKFKVPPPSGGGGTSFVPPFVWIEENIIKKGKKLGPVVYFTDGYGDFPSEKNHGLPSYKNSVFWVITGKDRPNETINTPFGQRADLIFGRR